MSDNTGSVASNDRSWVKLFAAVAALPLALAACGGGGGGGSPTPAPVPPAPAPTPTPTPAPSPTAAGINWANVSVATIGDLNGVDYADSTWVAVSGTGAAISSTDGATWTARTLFTSGASTDRLGANAIAHVGSNYVAVGSLSSAPYSSSSGIAAWSTDGVNWTMASTLSVGTPMHGVIGGTKFIGLGEAGHIYSSPDGHTWTSVTAISGVPTLNAGVYGNGRYVAVGDAGWIATSTDGSAWAAGQVVKVNSAGVNLHGVTYTGTMYVAVGDNGLIATSTDGAAWTPRTSALSGALRATAAGGGEIVIVGDSGIETSEDGITWTARNASGVAVLKGAGFGNGKFAAVGTASAIKTSSGG